MSRAERPRRPVPTPPAWWAVALVCAGVAWLRHAGALAHAPDAPAAAAIFAAIVAGIEIAGSYIATAAEVTVTWLASVVSWLATHVENILLSSGAMFSRVWDAVRIVWSNVVQPFLQWVDDLFNRFVGWLRDVFGPVFDWLNRVRGWVQDIYRRFIRPFIDTIDFIDALTHALDALHIHVLDGLDAVLDQIRNWVTQKFLWVYTQLNVVWNWVDHIVTLDGYLQRITLLLSMKRYLPECTRGFWAGQMDERRQFGDDYSRGRDYPLDSPEEDGGHLALYYQGQASKFDGVIPTYVEQYRIAAGIDPPGTTVPDVTA